MAYQLPPLPYAYDALEPHIDARTMEIHHTRHHQTYIDNANKALEGSGMADLPAEQLIAQLDRVPADKKTALRNNAGGHANHSLFWQVMTPQGQGQPQGELAGAIEQAFGSFDAFKQKFEDAAKTRFGSGWAWLVVQNGELAVVSTANQDNPLMGESISGASGTPILGVDVWEHAYYLNYQNKRPDYLAAFWNVVNWDEVARRYAEAKGQ
ncbi:Fe-Mn family superoxide dismutase [Deinococcus sp. HSC-46F16]|uniref:superoxide dismutase [Mn] n=1 Tax=Deinococcus sp. HSC-46F16 TaxID=2910968 RepID=UPI0020A18B62|nr:superoxide dismutase [Mn] [Deinococcus sp. HSC-46F16]MCP2013618.1 Fe-Mn family superoxide dismutase [Deinococcus sp. HSC-46F16]